MLKKVREFFNGAADDHTKGLYADFYNLLLEVLGEEDNKNYGEPISVIPQQTASSIEIEEFTEKSPVIVTANELAKALNKKITEIDSNDGRAAIVFQPSRITNPYIRDYLIDNRKKISKIPKGVCSTYTAHTCDCCELLFKKWAFDLRKAACPYGMIVSDGKNKPVILYGIFDYTNVVRKIGKKSTADREFLEKLRVSHMTEFGCPQGSFAPEGYMPGMPDYLGKADWAVYREDYACARNNLNKIPKDSPDYPASLLIQADLKKARQDSRALTDIYTELLQLLPEYREYWEQELKKIPS
ncbi:MAG: hypothetical protein LUH22_18525 [Bacteroides sp.]|nr:hypothetical protein [Bacteroides sp.]